MNTLTADEQYKLIGRFNRAIDYNRTALKYVHALIDRESEGMNGFQPPLSDKKLAEAVDEMEGLADALQRLIGG